MNPARELAIEDARRVLAAQPFSRLLGTRITAFADGKATLELDVRDDLRQQDGFVHGGVLAYAADNAITFAGGTALGPAVLTGGFTISYLRPAVGSVLRAEATVAHAGSRQAISTCELSVLDDTGAATLCAIAQGAVLARRG